jgi:hypothetical protein
MIFNKLGRDKFDEAFNDKLDVAIECLEIFHNFPHLFAEHETASLYMPFATKLFEETDLQFKVKLRLSEMMGKILHFVIAKKLLTLKFERQMLVFFRYCIEDNDE